PSARGRADLGAHERGPLLAAAARRRGHRLLPTSLGLGRNRLRRPGLSARLHAARARPARAVGRAGTAAPVRRPRGFALRRVHALGASRALLAPGREAVKRLGPMQTVELPGRRFRDNEPVDYCIVGVGSAGGVLLQRLARAGFKVVGLEAGPFWDTEKDWVSDEAGSHKLYWNELRISQGEHPLTLGENNSGRGVGGGSVHWAAFVPRLHPSDFRTYSEDGVGVDWPISYEVLKPYYELIEREMPAAGPLH